MATRDAIRTLPDLRPREAIVAGSLTFLVIVFGVFPGPVSDVSSSSVERLAQRLGGAARPATPR